VKKPKFDGITQNILVNKVRIHAVGPVATGMQQKPNDAMMKIE
jgi:hypothetical protein